MSLQTEFENMVAQRPAPSVPQMNPNDSDLTRGLQVASFAMDTIGQVVRARQADEFEGNVNRAIKEADSAWDAAMAQFPDNPYKAQMARERAYRSYSPEVRMAAGQLESQRLGRLQQAQDLSNQQRSAAIEAAGGQQVLESAMGRLQATYETLSSQEVRTIAAGMGVPEAFTRSDEELALLFETNGAWGQLDSAAVNTIMMNQAEEDVSNLSAVDLAQWKVEYISTSENWVDTTVQRGQDVLGYVAGFPIGSEERNDYVDQAIRNIRGSTDRVLAQANRVGTMSNDSGYSGRVADTIKRTEDLIALFEDARTAETTRVSQQVDYLAAMTNLRVESDQQLGYYKASGVLAPAVQHMALIKPEALNPVIESVMGSLQASGQPVDTLGNITASFGQVMSGNVRLDDLPDSQRGTVASVLFQQAAGLIEMTNHPDGTQLDEDMSRAAALVQLVESDYFSPNNPDKNYAHFFERMDSNLKERMLEDEGEVGRVYRSIYLESLINNRDVGAASQKVTERGASQNSTSSTLDPSFFSDLGVVGSQRVVDEWYEDFSARSAGTAYEGLKRDEVIALNLHRSNVELNEQQNASILTANQKITENVSNIAEGVAARYGQQEQAVANEEALKALYELHRLASPLVAERRVADADGIVHTVPDMRGTLENILSVQGEPQTPTPTEVETPPAVEEPEVEEEEPQTTEEPVVDDTPTSQYDSFNDEAKQAIIAAYEANPDSITDEELLAKIREWIAERDAR